ncbi:acyl-CoA dehydrogenase family protein [Candidatus Skiveiella danica]|uniref:acyl-CoA dehydrogenase family protein n=1 Tax=Candidatus Skiveiella danica TaxID=3386177 RepID=UPI0039B997BC
MLPGEYGEVTAISVTAPSSEELARAGVTGFSSACIPTSSAPHINRLGTEEQKRRWLPSICRGEKSLPLRWLQARWRLRRQAIPTAMERDGDECVISSGKTFISNGYLADLMVSRWPEDRSGSRLERR